MSSDGKRAGGHRRFGGSRLAQPWTAPTQRDPVVDRLLQLLDAAMGATPRPLGRRLRQPAAPPGSAVTTPHGHGRSRRRRRRAWRPPGGRGRSTSTKTQSTEHNRLQSVNHRTGRPIPHRRARPRHRMPLGRHLPTAPGQRSRSRLCTTHCSAWRGCGWRPWSRRRDDSAGSSRGRADRSRRPGPPTLAKSPRRSAWRSMIAKHTSHTRLSQDAVVGVTCSRTRRFSGATCVAAALANECLPLRVTLAPGDGGTGPAGPRLLMV